MKKQEKLSRLKSAGEQDESVIAVDQNGVAEKLYTGEYRLKFFSLLFSFIPFYEQSYSTRGSRSTKSG